MKLVNSNLSPLMAFGNLCPALNFYCFDLCSVLPMESTKGKGMYNGEPMPSSYIERSKIRSSSADRMWRESRAVASFVDSGGSCSDGSRRHRARVVAAEASRRRPPGSRARAGARAPNPFSRQNRARFLLPVCPCPLPSRS